jgi:hypothetical protein
MSKLQPGSRDTMSSETENSEGARALVARRQLARILRRLLAVPRQDLDRWAAETKGVERFLEEVYPDLPDSLRALHGVRHYLADADIRAADAEYADAQEQEMRDLIRRIETV